MELLADEGGLPRETVRVGLLPGSFNPPHAGHIELAVRAKASAGLHRILFYANSFNPAKRDQLASVEDRRSMLKRIIDPSYMSIIPDEFYSEAPADAWIGGSFSFAPLIDRLRSVWPPHFELWMLRGADYFTMDDGQATAYPRDLWHLPHVIGTRGMHPDTFDASMLGRSICVKTRPLSSSELRSAGGSALCVRGTAIPGVNGSTPDGDHLPTMGG